jgi:cytochrome d ubiquinol oxidase subunit II
MITIVIVSIWTPLADSHIAARWFSRADILWLSPVPILTGIVAYWEWRSLSSGKAEGAPFLASVLLFLLSYLGIAISLWPMIVPYKLTLWQAAASPSTQGFLLIGTLVLLPVILLYTAWSYWVFRGKVRGDSGYH